MAKKADDALYVLCASDNNVLVTDGDGNPHENLMTADQARELILSHHLAGEKPEKLRLYRVTPVPFDIGVNIRG